MRLGSLRLGSIKRARNRHICRDFFVFSLLGKIIYFMYLMNYYRIKIFDNISKIASHFIHDFIKLIDIFCVYFKFSICQRKCFCYKHNIDQPKGECETNNSTVFFDSQISNPYEIISRMKTTTDSIRVTGFAQEYITKQVLDEKTAKAIITAVGWRDILPQFSPRINI